MRSLNRLVDGLTYKDMAGKRHPRRYVLAAGAIFIMLCGIVATGWWQRQQLMDGPLVQPVIPAGDRFHGHPGAAAVEPDPVSAQPLPTPWPHTGIEIAGILTTDAPASASCPDDPSAWKLQEVARGDNFLRIDPACVYDGLSRTVAWDLLRVMGYSAPEAMKMLGFFDFPRRPAPEIIGMTNTHGPVSIELTNPSYAEIMQAGHPDFHAWIVDSAGKPGVTFTLRGCYSSENLQGDRKVTYPVICVAAMDQAEWAVMELGAHRFATRSLPTRRFYLYGYAGDGRWTSIGYQREPFVEIRQPHSGDPAVLPLTMDLDEIAADRNLVTALHGQVPWDAAWLEGTFGLAMRALPKDWQSQNNPGEYQAIQAEKEAWVRGGLP